MYIRKGWRTLLLMLLAGVLLPGWARSEASDWVMLCGVKLDSSTPYLAENGSAAVAAQPAGDYAYFHNGVLTLSGFSMSYSGAANSAALYASGDLTVVFSGDNSLDYTSGTVQQPAALRLENGTLTLRGQESTALLTLSVASTVDKTHASTGIEAPNIVVEGQGQVTASGGAASVESYGIRFDGSMTVTGQAKITAAAGEVKGASTARSVGVLAKGTLSVASAEAELIASGGTTTSSNSTNTPGSYGIYVTTQTDAGGGMTLSAGSIAATADAAYGESYGVYAYSVKKGGVEYPVNITVSGGKLDAAGGQSKNTRSAGIAMGASDSGIIASLTITGGEVEAIGGNVSTNILYGSYGFFGYAKETLVISGGTATFISGKKGYTMKATNIAPDLSLYSSPTIIASTNQDGSSPVEVDNPSTVTSYKYLRIGAVEAAVSIIVQASPAEGGSATLVGEQQVGSEVTATAQANAGYLFAGWYEGDNLVSDEADYTFTVSSSRNLTAKFSKATYRVSVSEGDGGSVYGVGEYAHGESVTLTATPEEGYVFDGWYEGDDLVSKDAEYTFTVSGSTNLTAKFSKATYRVSVSEGDGGSVSGVGEYTHGETVNLTATPEEGYVFDGWYEGDDLVSKDAEYTFTVSGSTNLTAKFSKATYTVSVSVGDGGSVSGADKYAHGESVTLTATPAEGYVFDGWYEGDDLVSKEAAYTFNVSSSRNLTAKFSKATYRVSVSVGDGGSVSGADKYAHGESVTLTATPAEGYVFDGWYEGDDLVSKDAEYTFNVSSSRNLTAKFSKATYRVSVSVGDGGSVSGVGEYTHGESVTLTATPEEGYVFDGWYEGDDLVSKAAEYTFNVSGSTNLTAKFIKATYRVSVSAGDGGSISGVGEYTHGETVTLTAVPAEGYVFAGWYEGDNLIGEDTIYTFTVHADNMALIASWSPIEYQITYDLAGGSVSGSNPSTYTITHESITLINPTRTGHVFAGWTGTALTSATQTVMIPAGSTGDRSYTATWMPAIDTPYMVKHYFENIEGDDYIIDETVTQNCFGTTGEQTTAIALERKGFTAQTVTQKLIAADGSTTVEIYYDRNEYTLTFNPGNGTASIIITGKYGAPITPPADLTNPGFDFAGWEPELPETIPATSEVYTAKWIASGNTPYTVEHYFACVEGDDYIIDETATQICFGTTGEQTEAKATTRDGFTAQNVTQKEIMADGSTAVEIYYDRNEYTLTLNLGNGAAPIIITGKYGAPITAPAAPTKPGFDFAGWEPELPETIPATAGFYTAKWIAIGNTPYTVEHYFACVDGDDYIKDESATQNCFGTTGDQTTAVVLEREGFTAQTVTQKPIAADGSTAVEIYYDRNEYTLTLDFGNGAALFTITGKYGAPITPPADPTNPGFDFAGWEPELPETIPYTDGVYTAKWIASGSTPYTVEHYFESIESDDYIKDESAMQICFGTTGDQTTAVVLEREGFTAQTVTQKPIAADGSTTVEIYYDRNEYTLTLNPGNGVAPIIITGKYGAPITAPVAPTKPGFDFAGWEPKLPATIPAANTTYTARWAGLMPATHTVRFVANGGSGIMEPLRYAAGSITLPACGFTAPAGKLFVGWALQSNGAVLASPYWLHADVTLYAIWADIPAMPQLPVIVAPQGDQLVEVYEGQPAILTVEADYANAYQWYADCGDGRGYVLIPDARSASYTTPPVVLRDDGCRYVCVISNGDGSVTSPAFELLVLREVIPPYTGDAFDLLLWLTLALISLAGLGAVKKAASRTC